MRFVHTVHQMTFWLIFMDWFFFLSYFLICLFIYLFIYFCKCSEDDVATWRCLHSIDITSQVNLLQTDDVNVEATCMWSYHDPQVGGQKICHCRTLACCSVQRMYIYTHLLLINSQFRSVMASSQKMFFGVCFFFFCQRWKNFDEQRHWWKAVRIFYCIIVTGDGFTRKLGKLSVMDNLLTLTTLASPLSDVLA